MNTSPDSIDYEVAEKALLEIPDGPIRRKARAALYEKNCVVKYRRPNDNSISALKDGKLFFSTALGYNDPHDTLMYVNYQQLNSAIMGSVSQVFPTYGEKQPDKNAYNYISSVLFKGLPEEKKGHYICEFLSHIRQDAEVAIQQVHDNVPGICFSNNFLSPLMWAHYADSHKGFALLYDRNELETASCFTESGEQVKSRKKLYDIKYQAKRPNGTEFIEQYLLNQYLKEKNSRRRLHGANPIDSPDQHPFPQTQLREIILTKSNEWSYECESRLLFRPITIEAEYQKRYLIIKPRAIILGAKMDQDVKHKVSGIARELGCTLYEAWINNSLRDYNVVFQEVI